MVTLDQTLDMAMTLSRDEREMLIDILRKREIEAWREETANDIRKDFEDFNEGKLREQTAEELIQSLRQSSDDDIEE